MPILGIEALSAAPLRRQEVPLPEWGGSVLVQELTSEQTDAVRRLAVLAVDPKTSKVMDPGALYRFQLRLIAAGWINADGTRVLQDNEIDKLKTLGNAAVERIASAVREISGMGDDAVAVAEKNSESSQSSDSGTS